MKYRQIGLSTFFFHIRSHFAVFLGVIIGSAVLTGALFVGDSLRRSLLEHSLEQLNGVKQRWSVGRWIESEICKDWDGVHAGIMLPTSVEDPSGTYQANQVTVYGTSNWPLDDPILAGEDKKAIVSFALANQLHLHEGDYIRARLGAVSNIPRSSILGRRSTEDTIQSVRIKVEKILSENHSANQLTLMPGPGTPLNLFMPLKALQKNLGFNGKCNLLYTLQAHPLEALQKEFKSRVQLRDWGIQITSAGQRDYPHLQVQSSQLMLDEGLVKNIHETANRIGFRYADTLVYLVNQINLGDRVMPHPNTLGLLMGGSAWLTSIPYALIAAVDLNAAAPLGPFLPQGIDKIGADEIVLLAWNDPLILGAEKGKAITLSYFDPEMEGKITNREKIFHLAGTIPMSGLTDRSLTPEFPGITDKLSIAEWDPPFPYDGSRIGKRDERFWNLYRTTPKGYISLESGQKLWGSRFGSVTSVRLAPPANISLENGAQQLSSELLKQLQQNDSIFQFQDIQHAAKKASSGSNDFGMLFLAFSLVLMVSALLLIGLLFRLNLEQRASEIGIMVALGYPMKQIRNLLLREGLLIALPGCSLGVTVAVYYAKFLLALLIDLWPNKGIGNYLQFHASMESYLIGWSGALAMSLGVIYLSILGVKRMAPTALIAGKWEKAIDLTPRLNIFQMRAKLYRWLNLGAFSALIFATILELISPFLPPGEAQAGGFFSAGGLFLCSGIGFFCHYLVRRKAPNSPASLSGLTGSSGLLRFGLRNLERNVLRSVSTVALLATAFFLLIAVESFRRQPEKHFKEKSGGSGGFPLLVKTAVPLFFNPAENGGQQEMLDHLQRFWQQKPQAIPFSDVDRNKGLSQALVKAKQIFQPFEWIPLHEKNGEDTSCLNLYQANQPRLLGVPQTLIQRGGFVFADSLAKSTEEQKNPWLLLLKSLPDNRIPIIVEQNTAMWMLKKGLGDEITLPAENGQILHFTIVGLLQDSVFQSEAIIADKFFLDHYPHQEGYRFLLVNPGKEGKSEADQEVIETLIEQSLRSYGAAVIDASAYLKNYLEVVNTYLTTFQILGGFGLFLGICGLAVILLRNVWERRSELALLQALGYRHRHLHQIVLIENLCLLLAGILIGTVSAFLSILPHWVAGNQVPWQMLLGLIAATAILAVTISSTAVAVSLRGPLIPALRKE